jgi:23S rRNA (uridine2552-2'-O)-methyltransferase
LQKKRIKDPRRVADHYTQRAKAEHYPARSVYKLQEIDRKHRLFKPGQRVLDLGCAPGSWTLYAAQRIGENGLVIGMDVNRPTIPFPAHVRIIQADVSDLPLDDIIGDGLFDVVMSDMAPKTTGIRDVDQARSADLARMALMAARRTLIGGGVFLVKIFMGPEEFGLMQNLAAHFTHTRRIKPKSSRSFSPEIFGLGIGYHN